MSRFANLSVRARLRIAAVFALTLGVGLGVALHFVPENIATRRTHCTVCALHHEETESETVFGKHVTRSDREAVLNKLLSSAVGDHEHAWMTPAAFVPPTTPAKKLDAAGEFQQAVAEAEVRDLELLEESPHLLALLDEAMRNDQARTLKLVQTILDPKAFVPVEAIALLDRPTSWENRWAVVDAFLDVYHCNANEVAVSCRMRQGPTDLLVLARTANSVATGSIDWQHWVPEGMTAPPGKNALPPSYAAVTPS